MEILQGIILECLNQIILQGIILECLNQITPEDWQDYCSQVKKLTQEFKNECTENVTEHFIINTESSDKDDERDSENSDSV